MIKILYVIDKMSLAGAQKHLTEVLSKIDKDKFDASIVTLEELGVKRIYDVSGLIGLIKLVKLLRKEKVDILHSYLFSENILGAIAGKIARVPIIITGRRDTGMLSEGKRRHFLAYRMTNSLVNKIVSVSHATKVHVQRTERAREDKIKVIYNGVDREKLKPNRSCEKMKSEIGVNDNDLIVGIIANLSWVKGHSYFLKSAKLIIDEMENVKFLVLGDGPLKDELIKQAEELGIADKVLFLGRRIDVPDLLSIMDVVAHSSFSEGISNAILEAMAAGKPVVAAAVDGNLETVESLHIQSSKVNLSYADENHATGVLTPVKDEKSMANAVIHLLKNPALATKLGKNAQAFIQKKFNAKKMVRNMENLYTELLKPKVAFIFSQFPSYDETFIAREMRELDEKDINFLIFSLTASKDAITHGEFKKLAERTLYAPFVSVGILWVQISCILRHPLRYISTFFYIIAIHIKSIDFILKSLAIFPKSVYMAKMLKARGITCIHAQWATHPATSAIIISRITGIPYSFTGHAHDIYVNTTGLKEKIRKAKFITTCTAANKQYLINIGNGDLRGAEKEGYSKKFVLNHHGINLGRFNIRDNGHERANVGRDKKVFKILSVGSLLECKGFGYLIEACKILKERGISFECTIAGGGPLHESLEYLAHSLKLTDHVKFTGYITQEALIPLYKEADIFVLAAVERIHWGIPNVLLEAMAAHTPVLCTPLPAVRDELIKNGEIGLIIPDGDPRGIADKMELLYNDVALRENMAKNGYARIRNEFDVQKNTSQLVELFNGSKAI